MSETKTNIGPEVARLFKKLGLEPPFVKDIHLTPTQVTVTVFKKNANGEKYLAPTHTTRQYLPVLDGEDEVDVTSFGHEPATEVITMEVLT